MNSCFLLCFWSLSCKAHPEPRPHGELWDGLALLRSGFTPSLGDTSALLAKNAVLYDAMLCEMGLGDGKQNGIKNLALSCFVLWCKPRHAQLLFPPALLCAQLWSYLMEKWSQQSLRSPASSLGPLLCSLYPGLSHMVTAVRGHSLAVGLRGGQVSRTSLCNSLPVPGVFSLKPLIDSPVPAELMIQ